jgi:hypothetical protein
MPPTRKKFLQRAEPSGRLFFSWLKANPDKALAKKNLTESATK